MIAKRRLNSNTKLKHAYNDLYEAKYGEIAISSSNTSGLRPIQYNKKLAECQIVNYPDTKHRANLEAFIKGNKKRIILRRDPFNKIDKNAIKVVGIWQDEKNLWHIGQIGWIPREIAFIISRESRYSVLFAQILKISKSKYIRGPQVTIAIWC